MRYGERPEVAYGLPFSVDGMLVVATIVMVDDKRRTHRVRPMARLAFVVGVAASIAANIAAAHPSLGARLIDAWPAVALLLVVEMLARPPAAAHPTAAATRPISGAAEAEVVPVRKVPAGGGSDRRNVEVPPQAVRQAARAAEVQAAESPTVESGTAGGMTELAGRAELPDQRQGARKRRPTAATRRMAETLMAEEPGLSRVELASRLGVSTRRLREVLAT